MFRNKSVNVHNFSMVPKAEIPRSSFRMQKTLKTAWSGQIWGGNGSQTDGASMLIPVLCEEVLPGDTWSMRMTAFARLATPIFPVMDNLYLDSFFFFVPNRLVWDNWDRFMGERRPDPDSSIDFTIPQITTAGMGGVPVGSVYDYFGIPNVQQYPVSAPVSLSFNALPLRGYNLIWNEWFRDQNLFDSRPVLKTDGPDAPTTANYRLLPRGKRHDYFTSCLPWPQKGDAGLIPLVITGTAPVTPVDTPPNVNNVPLFRTASVATPAAIVPASAAIGANLQSSVASSAEAWQWTNQTGLEVNLSTATANTINQLRQSFQIQRLLERDARGGTRYTELIRSHFGVLSPDARLQRPEYLGGGTSRVNINPVAQTSATAASGTDTPQGNLSAIGTGLLNNHGFTYSATEHGYIIGMVCHRADLTYQQGLRRHWSRRTRYDYYWPVFAMLGEQAVLNKEIYADGQTAQNEVFGYQERWAEYRYLPSEITGLMRSTAPNTIDAWHYSQRFLTRPVLNEFFIVEAPPIQRTTAVGVEAAGQQFIMDAFFDAKVARPLPMYSVPGLIDHL